jgi:arabinose-5-phosphate isomerase
VAGVAATVSSLPRTAILRAAESPFLQRLVRRYGMRLGAARFVAGETLVGIVTDGDLRRHMGEGLLNSTVDEVMTPHPRTIDPQALAAEALAQMNASDGRPVLVLFVVDEASRPLGVVHLHDLLRAGVA